ncbi:hypothetical protein OROHE_000910 [Orobanche hederae]
MILAVVAAIFSSRDVSSDPAQWLQVCTDLKNLKYIPSAFYRLSSVIGGQLLCENSLLRWQGVDSWEEHQIGDAGCRRWHITDDISEERILALRKRAEVDSRNIIFCARSRGGASTIVVDCICRTGKHILYGGRSKNKSASRKEKLHLYGAKCSVCVKYYKDWLEALKLHEDAYHAPREMVGTSTRMPPIQCLAEIKTVAEQLHFKMSTLLLHGGKVLAAIVCFRQHTASYRKLVGAPEVIFLHWEWLSRQYMYLLNCWRQARPMLCTFQLAASYLKEKNTCLQFSLSMSVDIGPADGSAVCGGFSVSRK